MAVGIGRTAAWLTVAVAFVAATQVPTAACRAVVTAAPGVGEAEAELQCVRRCTTEMLACAAASGCASTTATVWQRRRGGGGSVALAPCGGGGFEGEYLGCIDVC